MKPFSHKLHSVIIQTLLLGESWGVIRELLMTTATYETDFYGWTERQAALLRAEEFEAVDWNNLIEEIETLGRSEAHKVENRLIVLIMHLLKWAYQPERRSRGWEHTIAEQRDRLDRLLRKNPTLRARLPEMIEFIYPYAVKKALRETSFLVSPFPPACPYASTEILDDNFLPDE